MADLLPGARVGAWEVISLLGRGGMGTVYRARASNGYPIALKVIRSEIADHPEASLRFVREARAAARLTHPNLARVIDFGTSDGRRWMALELVDGTPMTSWRDAPPDAETLLEAFDQVLAALAHAHAKQVVHADVKPENVLVGYGKDGRVRARLMDFGIAHFRGESVDAGSPLVGTPAYMPPERALRIDEITPAGDLYAAGVLLWELLTGRLPFDAQSPAGLLFAHLREPLPAFRAREVYACDAATERFLERLLAKEPRDRFLFAADAREALRGCGIRDRVGTGAFVTASAADEFSRDATDPARRSVLPTSLPTRSGSFASVLPVEPEGGRFSLFNAREIPFRGREAELKQLLEFADEAVELGGTHAIVITGDLGLGKSRLATALREALEEGGIMQGLWGECDPTGRPLGALRQALARSLELAALPKERRMEALERHVADWEAPPDAAELRELAVFLHALPSGRDAERALDDGQRFACVERVLEATARRRSLCVVLDNLQSADTALLRLVERLMDREQSKPTLLFVLLTRPELSSEDSERRRVFDRLHRHPSGQLHTLRLSRLDLPTIEKLLRSAVPLPTQVARAIAMRAGGNPLIAMALLDPLVESGRLEGYGEEPTALEVLQDLPEAVGDLLERRLVEAASSPGSDALTLFAWKHFAVLGNRFDAATAYEMLRLAGVPGTARVLDRAFTVGMTMGVLLSEDLVQYRFENVMMRDTLVERVRADGEQLAMERLAAQAWVAADPGDRPELGREVALHWERAGRPEEALPWVLESAEKAMAAHSLDAARQSWEQALALARVLDGPDALIRCLLGLARCHLALANFEPARQHALEARRIATHTGRPAVAESTRILADAAARLGNLDESRTLYAIAMDELSRSGDPAGAAPAWAGLAEVELRLGRVQEAEQLLLRARMAWSRANDAAGTAKVERGLAEAALRTGLHDESWRILRQAMAHHQQVDDRRGLALCRRLEGELLAASGDRNGALAAYDEAIEYLDAIGSSWSASVARYLRALALEAGGSWEHARKLCVRAAEGFELVGDIPWRLTAAMTGARLAGGAGHWPMACRTIERILDEDAIARVDDARFIESLAATAVAAARAGEVETAGSLHDLLELKRQRVVLGDAVLDDLDTLRVLLSSSAG